MLIFIKLYLLFDKSTFAKINDIPFVFYCIVSIWKSFTDSLRFAILIKNHKKAGAEECHAQAKLASYPGYAPLGPKSVIFLLTFRFISVLK